MYDTLVYIAEMLSGLKPDFLRNIGLDVAARRIFGRAADGRAGCREVIMMPPMPCERGFHCMDLSEALDASQLKHGERSHAVPAAMWEAATLWGVTPEMRSINDCGVFTYASDEWTLRWPMPGGIHAGAGAEWQLGDEHGLRHTRERRRVCANCLESACICDARRCAAGGRFAS